MNKIILKGRLTNNPDLKQTPSGVSVTKFTIAVNRRFDREKTDFINCEAWRNTAEFISNYFTKGKEIAVVGELHIDKTESNGVTRYFTNVVVDEAEFCGSKGDSSADTVADEPEKPNFVEVTEDDLPF